MTRHVITLAIALVVCAGSGLALAQPSNDKAAAEALFAEGRTLMKQGQHARACEKFAASHRLEPSVGALLNLGDCQEKRGKLASAWTSFREAAALARRLGDPVRAEFAMQRADAVHERLSYLTIEVPETSRISGLSITRNDEPVDEALWNQRAPVDPGPYVIRAEAPGHERLEIRIEVRTGADHVTVSVSGLQPARVARPAPEKRRPGVSAQPAGDVTAAARPESLPDGLPDGRPERRPERRAEISATSERAAPGMPMRRKLALASGGVSVAALATGVVLGLRARSRWNEAMEYCPDNVCEVAKGVELGNQARRLGLGANIGYGVGGVAAAAGIYLWFTAHPADDARDAHVIAPLLAPDLAGIEVRARF